MVIYILGAIVALILAYFIAGRIVSDWLDRECDKMLADAMVEDGRGLWFKARGMHSEACWHYGNAEILRRNVRACRRVAMRLRALKRNPLSVPGLVLVSSVILLVVAGMLSCLI